jgi:DNA-binding Lrp family transcriptional regulator
MKAFICINTLACSATVVEDLKKVSGVSEVYPSKGLYDVVALVEARSMNELREVILPDIRKVDNMKSTLTLTVLES